MLSNSIDNDNDNDNDNTLAMFRKYNFLKQCMDGSIFVLEFTMVVMIFITLVSSNDQEDYVHSCEFMPLVLIFMIDSGAMSADNNQSRSCYLSKFMPLYSSLFTIALMLSSIYAPILILNDTYDYKRTLIVIAYMMFVVYGLHLVRIPIFYKYCQYHRKTRSFFEPLISS